MIKPDGNISRGPTAPAIQANIIPDSGEGITVSRYKVGAPVVIPKIITTISKVAENF